MVDQPSDVDRAPAPVPTPVYRLMHVDSLPTLVQRGALHAPNNVPPDGLPYQAIHAARTQTDRSAIRVPCGPGGTIADYIGFYFGPRSPMLLRLHTGRNVEPVEQSRLVYLVSTAQRIHSSGLPFVFTDRHSLAKVARFYDSLDDLRRVDFATCNARQWSNTLERPDRQEKKQAEFLVHKAMPWALVERIGVFDLPTKHQVCRLLPDHGTVPAVEVERNWYY